MSLSAFPRELNNTSFSAARADSRTISTKNASEQSGRSMIEMLGVLAIIGVLSVGGIAGFSKAMEQYKVNKAIGEYSYLIQGLLEHITDIRKISKAGDTTIHGLAKVVEAMGLVPQTWNRDDTSTARFEDPYGNTIQIFSRNSRLVIDMYLGGVTIDDEGAYMTQNFSPKFCRELFQNVAKPLSSAVYYVFINGTGKNFYGTEYCSASQKCLRDLSVSDINTACNSCVADKACGVIFEF